MSKKHQDSTGSENSPESNEGQEDQPAFMKARSRKGEIAKAATEKPTPPPPELDPDYDDDDIPGSKKDLESKEDQKKKRFEKQADLDEIARKEIEAEERELLRNQNRILMATLHKLNARMDQLEKGVGAPADQQTAILVKDNQTVEALTTNATVKYDPKDALKIPVIFYTRKRGHELMDDRENGQDRPNPLRHVVKFEEIEQFNVGTAKNQTVIFVSAYACRSIKELDWLRNHSRYIKDFSEFDASTQGEDIDIDVEQARDQAASVVTGWESNQIIEYAENILNLKYDGSPNGYAYMKQRVILAKAKEYAATTKKSKALRLTERLESENKFRENPTAANV